MKNNIIYFALCLLLGFAACRPDTPPSLESPANTQELLQGTWKLQTALQYDPDAEFKSFPSFVTVADITKAVDGLNFQDFRFTISGTNISITKGTAPIDIAAGSGTYSLVSAATGDLSDFATNTGINGYSGMKITIAGTVYNLAFGAVNGLDNTPATLTLKQEVSITGAARPIVRYEYQMVKQ